MNIINQNFHFKLPNFLINLPECYYWTVQISIRARCHNKHEFIIGPLVVILNACN